MTCSSCEWNRDFGWKVAARGEVGTTAAGVLLGPCARIFIMSLLAGLVAGRTFLWDLAPCEMVMLVSYFYCVWKHDTKWHLYVFGSYKLIFILCNVENRAVLRNLLYILRHSKV